MSRADYVLVSVAALCLAIVGVVSLPFTDYGGVLGIVGVVIGVALGLYGDRWLRYRGDVYCQIERLGEKQRHQGTGSVPLKVSQSIQVHFFNDKEVDTGLTGLAVVFVFEDEEVALGPETRGYETSTSPLGVINLPSRTWVSIRVKGDFYGPEVKAILTDLRAIEIKGKFPDRTLYHKKILIMEASSDVYLEPKRGGERG
jgi:hypothetical protein